MNPDAPYLSVAALCDTVLIEKDERVTCVRFLDTLNIEVGTEISEPLPPIGIHTTAFVAFKSGNFKGVKECSLRLTSPSGKTGIFAPDSPRSYPMTFKGDEHGHNLTLTLNIPLSETGLYWFDVMLDDEVYTRIPLRINIIRKQPDQNSSESWSQILDPLA